MPIGKSTSSGYTLYHPAPLPSLSMATKTQMFKFITGATGKARRYSTWASYHPATLATVRLYQGRRPRASPRVALPSTRRSPPRVHRKLLDPVNPSVPRSVDTLQTIVLGGALAQEITRNYHSDTSPQEVYDPDMSCV